MIKSFLVKRIASLSTLGHLKTTLYFIILFKFHGIIRTSDQYQKAEHLSYQQDNETGEFSHSFETKLVEEQKQLSSRLINRTRFVNLLANNFLINSVECLKQLLNCYFDNRLNNHFLRDYFLLYKCKYNVEIQKRIESTFEKMKPLGPNAKFFSISIKRSNKNELKIEVNKILNDILLGRYKADKNIIDNKCPISNNNIQVSIICYGKFTEFYFSEIKKTLLSINFYNCTNSILIIVGTNGDKPLEHYIKRLFSLNKFSLLYETYLTCESAHYERIKTIIEKPEIFTEALFAKSEESKCYARFFIKCEECGGKSNLTTKHQSTLKFPFGTFTTYLYKNTNFVFETDFFTFEINLKAPIVLESQEPYVATLIYENKTNGKQIKLLIDLMQTNGSISKCFELYNTFDYLVKDFSRMSQADLGMCYENVLKAVYRTLIKLENI